MAAIEAAVNGGVDAIYLRDRASTARALDARVRDLKIAVGEDVWVIVNDRVDVAMAAGADGVQLGGSSLRVEDARRVAGDLRLGASVHSVGEAEDATRQGADWLVLGTIYASRSHPGQAGAGPSLVEATRRRTDLPVVAIGGITHDNVADVLQAGAYGIAVISAILGSSSPRDAAVRFREAIEARFPS